MFHGSTHRILRYSGQTTAYSIIVIDSSLPSRVPHTNRGTKKQFGKITLYPPADVSFSHVYGKWHFCFAQCKSVILCDPATVLS